MLLLKSSSLLLLSQRREVFNDGFMGLTFHIVFFFPLDPVEKLLVIAFVMFADLKAPGNMGHEWVVTFRFVL